VLFLVVARDLFPEAGGMRLKLSRVALSLGLTIATASASYAWLERPALRLKERFTFVPSRGV
jgi:peptidoglycan/LPS O-acetylase OafA/YrhL